MSVSQVFSQEEDSRRKYKRMNYLFNYDEESSDLLSQEKETLNKQKAHLSELFIILDFMKIKLFYILWVNLLKRK